MSHKHRSRLPLLTVLVLLSAGTAAMPASAELDRLTDAGGLSRDSLSDERPLDKSPVGPEAHERTRAAQHVTRAQAAAQARNEHGGRVLSVNWTGNDYRVKLLRHGEVRIVRVADAPPEQEDP